MQGKMPSPNTVTGKIYRYIFKELEEHPEGIRWVDLNDRILKKYPDFHPKTINGCIWKLTQLFPEEVHKPEKGLFQLK